jgi:hypothetical protein
VINAVIEMKELPSVLVDGFFLAEPISQIARAQELCLVIIRQRFFRRRDDGFSILDQLTIAFRGVL